MNLLCPGIASILLTVSIDNWIKIFVKESPFTDGRLNYLWNIRWIHLNSKLNVKNTTDFWLFPTAIYCVFYVLLCSTTFAAYATNSPSHLRVILHNLIFDRFHLSKVLSITQNQVDADGKRSVVSIRLFTYVYIFGKNSGDVIRVDRPEPKSVTTATYID